MNRDLLQRFKASDQNNQYCNLQDGDLQQYDIKLANFIALKIGDIVCTRCGMTNPANSSICRDSQCGKSMLKTRQTLRITQITRDQQVCQFIDFNWHTFDNKDNKRREVLMKGKNIDVTEEKLTQGAIQDPQNLTYDQRQKEIIDKSQFDKLQGHYKNRNIQKNIETDKRKIERKIIMKEKNEIKEAGGED